MNKAIKIIIGLLIALAGVYTYVGLEPWGPANWDALLVVVRGCFGLGLIGIGLIFILIGFTE